MAVPKTAQLWADLASGVEREARTGGNYDQRSREPRFARNRTMPVRGSVRAFPLGLVMRFELSVLQP